MNLVKELESILTSSIQVLEFCDQFFRCWNFVTGKTSWMCFHCRYKKLLGFLLQSIPSQQLNMCFDYRYQLKMGTIDD
ncbi:hypothetical protein LXL04_017685 [Taraxacum kok-saghyz]